MRCNFIIKGFVFFAVVLTFNFCGQTFAQVSFDKMLTKKVDSLLTPQKIPLHADDALQAISIPTGYGGYGFNVFGGIGGIYPQAYTTRPDLVATGGVCIGNPEKFVNLAASVNVQDVSKGRDLTYNFTLSRVIFVGTSISAGALQEFPKAGQSDVPGASYYLALSHAVQGLPSKTPGASKLTYTIGIGSGRFYQKSPDDLKAGRGVYGTAIFGDISYEIIHHVNLNAEWSGLNLGASLGVRPFKSALSLGLGVVNLLNYSSNKPSGVFTLGYPLSLTR